MRDLGDVIRDLSDADAEASDEAAGADAGGSDRDLHLYSTLAPVYDFVYDQHFDYDGQRELVDETVPDDTESVLEVGSGTGRLLARLDDQYERAVGLERSEAMARRARIRTDAEVVVGDATSADLDERFDAVVMLGRVTGHATEVGEAERLVENCLTHLRPGGILLFDYFSTERMEDDYESSDVFESEAYRVERETHSTIPDDGPDRPRTTPDRMHTEFEYELLDRGAGDSATVSETMTLRTFSHDAVRDLLADASFAEVTIREEAADGWPLAVAHRPEGND